jgi:DNA polymerase IIIc chi subunit
MTEILFYHLVGQRLEQALPQLLEKSLERGWNALVRAGSEERLAVLDEALWTYSEASFLPHGREEEGEPEHGEEVGVEGRWCEPESYPQTRVGWERGKVSGWEHSGA